MKKIFYLFIFVSLFSSCDKYTSEALIENESNNEKPEARIASQNEFEIFGQVHNLGLDYIAQQVGFEDFTQIQMFNASHKFEYENWFDSLNTEYSDFLYAQTLSHNVYANPSTAAGDLADELNLNSLIEGYLNDIIMVFEYVSSQADLEIAVTPNEVDELIKEIESKILTNELEYNSSTGMGDDYAAILMSSSIAKYSYRYWYNAAFDETNAWHFVFDSGSKGPIRDFFNKAKAVVQDDITIGYIIYHLRRDEGQGVVESLWLSTGDGISGSSVGANG